MSTRTVFLIRRILHVGWAWEYFNEAQGMWWKELANATHYATEDRAQAAAAEWCMSPYTAQIQQFVQHQPLDPIFDEDDPDAGEEWKNG